ncbi:cytochrome b5 [Zopfochytrium polystomum]|nr:cytochrome b5 [Zopfochytrium polystomum]
MAIDKVFTYEELSSHNNRESAYMVIDGLVIDVTRFLEEHPGGEEVLLEQAGIDASGAFDEIGHSDDARALMKTMAVGKIDDSVTKASSSSEPTKFRTGAPTSTSISGILLGLVPVAAAIAFIVYRYLETQQ